jgi:hypothetical protein
MDKDQIHITAEICAFAGMFYHFNNQINKLNHRIDTLEGKHNNGTNNNLIIEPLQQVPLTPTTSIPIPSTSISTEPSTPVPVTPLQAPTPEPSIPPTPPTLASEFPKEIFDMICRSVRTTNSPPETKD